MASFCAASEVPQSPIWLEVVSQSAHSDNVTPIGASANVMGTAIAEKEGHKIGRERYCEYALRAMTPVVGLCSICSSSNTHHVQSLQFTDWFMVPLSRSTLSHPLRVFTLNFVFRRFYHTSHFVLKLPSSAAPLCDVCQRIAGRFSATSGDSLGQDRQQRQDWNARHAVLEFNDENVAS
jgi:hypothetical protein